MNKNNEADQPRVAPLKAGAAPAGSTAASPEPSPSLTHTPGPWTVDGMVQTVRAAKGQMTVCDIRGWGYLTGVGGLHLSDEQAFAIQTANARLIADAPSMYDALHLAHSYFASHSTGDNEATEHFRRIGAILARIKGGR